MLIFPCCLRNLTCFSLFHFKSTHFSLGMHMYLLPLLPREVILNTEIQTYQWLGGTVVLHFEGQDPGRCTGPGFHLLTPRLKQGSAATPLLQRCLGRGLAIINIIICWKISSTVKSLEEVNDRGIAECGLFVQEGHYQWHCCWEGKLHVPDHPPPVLCRTDGNHRG